MAMDWWQHHWLQSMIALDGRVLQRVPGMTLVLNPHVDGPLQNFALWREIHGEPAAQLAQVETLLAQLGREPAVWVTPTVAPAVEPLLATSYRPQRLTVLARDLGDLPPMPELPPGVTLRTVSAQELPVWAATVVAAFGWNPLWQGALAVAYRAAMATGGVGYLLQRHGEPIGCGWLQPTGETAGLYAGGVVAAERCKGLGQALVLRRLHDARAAGLSRATLQVDPTGAMDRLCRRMGFTQVGEAVVWQKSAPAAE
jgi:GNAT superfamily N-acetyltransferase